MNKTIEKKKKDIGHKIHMSPLMGNPKHPNHKEWSKKGDEFLVRKESQMKRIGNMIQEKHKATGFKQPERKRPDFVPSFKEWKAAKDKRKGK